jgi:hypothetical protein
VIDLNIVRIPDTPMKLVFKGSDLYGCFWYNNFYRKDGFTGEMQLMADKHHAATLTERVNKEAI